MAKSDDQHLSNYQLEMFRVGNQLGQNAIRSSFLLNGGASIALLAFIGHLASIQSESILLFAQVLMLFALGGLLITVASGCAYFGMLLHANGKDKSQRSGACIILVCIVLGVLSYICFMLGMYCAYNAFASL